MGPGHFIVVEGIDGSGSTTQAKLLRQQLEQEGIAVSATHEPSDGAIGLFIRSILERRLSLEQIELETVNDSWSTLALLFASDRLDNVNSRIRPALRRGDWVVSDRYVLSSLAYQSSTSPGGTAVVPWLREINSLAPPPSLTLVLDVEPERAAARRQRRGLPSELFEHDELQRRLAAVYREAPQLLPAEHKVRLIDGNPPERDVASAIWTEVSRLL